MNSNISNVGDYNANGNNSTVIINQLPQNILDLIRDYREREYIIMNRYIDATEKYLHIIANLKQQIAEKDNIIKHLLETKQ